MTEPDAASPGLADLRRMIVDRVRPVDVNGAVLDRLLAAGRLTRFSRHDVVLRQGDVSRELHFVTSGILRYYYLAEGVEYTGQFMSAGMFIADLASFSSGLPADQTIDALTPATTIALPRAALVTAMQADHGIERFVRIVIEEAFAGSQRRSANLLMRSPEERYDWLAANRPEVLRLVPQFILASYLGVTPESLSRIRKRRARPGRA